MSTSPDVDLEIRRAQQKDAERVRALVCAAYAKWIPVIGREPMPMTADFHHTIREHDVQLAIHAGEVVGVIETWLQTDHLWIENVAVHPQRQGIGIGRRLLAQTEIQANQADVGEVRLQTNEAFAANIAFYTALGYGIDRREPFKGGTTVFMSKKVL